MNEFLRLVLCIKINFILLSLVVKSYSILKREDIIRMSKIAPDAKLVFLVRNPIDRAWSQFKHENRLDKNFDINNINFGSITKIIFRTFFSFHICL